MKSWRKSYLGTSGLRSLNPTIRMASEVTAANMSERDVVHRLIREDDEVVYGDAGYTGMSKRPEKQSDLHLSAIDYRTNIRNRFHSKSKAPGIDWDACIERQKSRVRSKVEYVFLIIKRIFGYDKVRYRGLKKNETQAYLLCALVNLFLLAQSGWHGECLAAG